ncbi:MAG: response regulator [Pontixanthobacter sp.]
MSKNVLIVEDDFFNRLLMVTLVEAEGHAVLEATHGREALDILGHTIPDLIVMDINMPEMSGTKVLERLKARPQWANIPVLVVSGYARADEQRSFREAGADRIISKPISNVNFIEACSELLAYSNA